MKNRLVELLKSIPKRPHIVNGVHVGTKLHTAESVAEYLIEQGVVLPPCKLGDTVYAAINPIFETDEEPSIDEWEVKGIAYEGGDAWFLESKDDEWYEIGEDLCKLTREEAEQALNYHSSSDKS